MIEQQGVVVASSNGQAQVRLGGRSGCAACDAGRGCGAGVFGRLLQRRPVLLSLDNRLGAGQGQAVMVGLPESWFLALVTRFYLYPLLAGLVGAVLGHYVSSTFEFGTTVKDAASLLGALLAGGGAVWHNRKWSTEFSGLVDVHLLRVVDEHNLDNDKEVVS
jgi:sigma-E factor negative regulatory protein RseC